MINARSRAWHRWHEDRHRGPTRIEAGSYVASAFIVYEGGFRVVDSDGLVIASYTCVDGVASDGTASWKNRQLAFTITESRDVFFEYTGNVSTLLLARAEHVTAGGPTG